MFFSLYTLVFLWPSLTAYRKVIGGNSGHAQTSDSFVLVLNKEQHYNYNSSTVTSYTHMLENEHDTKSMQYIIIHKYAIHTNK